MLSPRVSVVLVLSILGSALVGCTATSDEPEEKDSTQSQIRSNNDDAAEDAESDGEEPECAYRCVKTASRLGDREPTSIRHEIEEEPDYASRTRYYLERRCDGERAWERISECGTCGSASATAAGRCGT